MRRRVLSMAVLLGLASLADSAEVRATPALSASITIEQSNVVQITGKRAYGHQSFHGGKSVHHGKSFARHHRGFRHKAFEPHQGFARHRGFPRHDVFVAKGIGGSHFVIVRPAYGQSFRRHYAAPRPLIKNGSFARRPYW